MTFRHACPTLFAAVLFVVTLSHGVGCNVLPSPPDDREVFIGNIIFTDESTLEDCRITDHNPGPIGSGWNMKTVAFCRTLEEALNHDTNRTRAFRYADIQTIEVLSLLSTEEALIHNMYYYDRDKLIKCDVTFHDGEEENAIFLLPHYLRYESTYKRGEITRATVKRVVFHE
jgi:hypothetical protein